MAHLIDKEKIKVTDLMIGDWIIFHDSSNVSIKCTVRSIDKDSNLIVEWMDDGDVYSELTHDISPVPLTPEILEKNGFKPYIPEGHLETVYACQDVSKAVADELYALWPHQDGSFYLLLRVDGKDMVRMDVHYIHQLQHALRLCEIEKEIEL